MASRVVTRFRHPPVRRKTAHVRTMIAGCSLVLFHLPAVIAGTAVVAVVHASASTATAEPGVAPDSAPVGESQAGDRKLVEEIIAAHERIREKFRNGTFKIRYTDHLNENVLLAIETRGTLAGTDPELLDEKNQEVITTVSKDLSVIVEDRKIRSSAFVKGIYDGGPGLGTRELAFDGSVEMQYRQRPFDNPPSGTIDTKSASDEPAFAFAAPLCFLVMPGGMNTGFSLDVEKAAVETREKEINGERCAGICRERFWDGESWTNYIVWYSYEKDFLPIRKDTVHEKVGTLNRLDIEYKRDSVHGWLPSRWASVFYDFSSGERHVRSASEMALLDAEFNSDLPAGTFSLTFPKGTEVIDRRSKSRQQFIADGQGNLASELTFEVSQEIEPSDKVFLMIATLLAFAAFVAYWSLRRRRRKTHPTDV